MSHQTTDRRSATPWPRWGGARIGALLALPLAFLLADLGAAPAAAQRAVEVRVELPQRSRLDLTGRESVAPLPFLVIAQEGEERIRAERGIDVEAEFERYLFKVLRRETELEVLEPGPVRYPTFDLQALVEERDFWRDLGERTQADLLVFGSLDFDVQDRSGYRTEPFTSPLDGRTYYRQVLVEQTGFEYDILMFVFDGDTGEVLYRDNFKDFQSFQTGQADPLVGMFENLVSLEDRILGVFTQKEVEVSRFLFRDP